MITILGYLIVLGAVVGGFALEGGPVVILNQTIEFLIIGGAAIGALLAGTPLKVLSNLDKNLKTAIFGAGYSRADYMDLFQMLYEVFSAMRKSGEMALEKDVDDPANSETFKKHPKFLANAAASALMLDSLRLVISGSANAEELSHLMDEEIPRWKKKRVYPRRF